PALKDMYSLVVTGPLMTPDKRLLLEQTARNDHVTLVEFTPDILSYVAAADLVVSMAGYNTVCENLSLGVRSLYVPRVRPRSEQAIRATRLARLGLAHVLMPDELTGASLEAAIKTTLAAPLTRVNLNMKGLARASRAIGQILDTRTSLPEDVRLESVISV
ncbi:MAG TPA: glycosyltransferase, partial [Anaerolineae bacterium]